MKKLVVTLALGLFVTGCADTAVISQINDSSLEIQAGLGTTDDMIMAQARWGCGIYNKTPVAISRRCLDEYCFRKAVLFACK